MGFFFESYVGEGDLEKKEGRFSLKPLKGVGVLSHWRVLLSMMKGEGREEQGDEGVWSSGRGKRDLNFLMHIVILIGS